MALVLGVSAGYHDAAAALVHDGTLLGAIQEERLSRVKGDASLPLRAIEACLQLGRIEAGALDAVVFYEDPYAKLERVLRGCLRSFPRGAGHFARAMASQLGGKLWVLDALASQLGVSRRKVSFGSHHRSHAASAFYPSPFARAAVLVVDGVGERASTSLWRGDEQGLQLLESIEFPHSLGLLYAAITAYLGFAVNDGEYKVMGLAAYGTPRLREAFGKLIRLGEHGAFTLDASYFDEHQGAELGFGPKLEALLGPRRALGRSWNLSADTADPADLHYADVAASLQAVTQDALLALAARARELAGCAALCLAGGVALNAVANARLSQAGPLFVQPAAGDAGAAVGAALEHARALGDPRDAPWLHAAHGVSADASDAFELGTALGLRVSRPADPLRALAQRIGRGEVVGLVQGRFELGPRALGMRSLLAAPSAVALRERMNRVVKRREPFRPFAPAVLLPMAADWFGPADPRLTPFMTTVAQVLPERRHQLQAVTHVDGSARLQTVEPASVFGQLLSHVERETGVPIVLNTSLNAAGAPIAASALDALHFIDSHRIDALLVEDVLLEPRSS